MKTIKTYIMTRVLKNAATQVITGDPGYSVACDLYVVLMH